MAKRLNPKIINPKVMKGHFTFEKSDIYPVKTCPTPKVSTKDPPKSPIWL